MDLGEVLTKAWKIIWKNKVLWIFGILASCSQNSGGGGGGGSNPGMNFNLPGNQDTFNNGNNPFSNGQFPPLEEFVNNLDSMFNFNSDGGSIMGILIGLFCLVLFIGLLFLMLGTIGRIGLIRGTMLSETGQDPLAFGQLWAESTPYFWKCFLLNLLYGLVITLAVVILMIPLLALTFGTFGIGSLCLIPAICVLIPVGIALNILIEQANIALVVENLGIWDSVKRGWAVCRENLGPIAVVGLIVIIGGGIVGIVISLPMILLVIPAVMMGTTKDQSTLTTMMGLIGVMLCCLTPLVVVLQGILQSYIGSVWTLVFLRLTGKQPEQPEFQVLTMPE